MSKETKGTVTDEDKLRRQQLGQWIKRLRERHELTQREASIGLGYDYLTTVSQFERGVAPLPPRLWKDMAELYGVDPRIFAMHALKLLQPEVFEMLFGQTKTTDGDET